MHGNIAVCDGSPNGRRWLRWRDRRIRLPLKDLFSERREGQFHRKICGSVVFVDYGIDLDDFETQQSTVVGDDLHGEMSFAISCAAAYGSTHTRSVFRVDPVHIEGYVIAGGIAPGQAERLFHHGPHAEFIDVAHGENT